MDANTPKENALTEASTVMDAYDVILFPCQGGAGTYSGANWPNTLTNLGNYTAAGGRMFATHYHYDLLQPNPAFAGTANWTLNANGVGQLLRRTPSTTRTSTPTFATGGPRSRRGSTRPSSTGVRPA